MRHIIAENYLCFYALLEVILSEIGINEFSQYDLANKFGVVLPYGHSIPTVHNVSFSDDIRAHGAHIDEEKINSFFEAYKIKLKISYIPENPYIDYDYDKSDYSAFGAHQYYIYAYSYGSLYNDAKNYLVGHVSLLLNCQASGQLEIYDPGPRSSGVKVVKRIAMHDAMDDIHGGVYIIERFENAM